MEGDDMKGTLVFDLPEDQDSFKLAQDGWKYKLALDDLNEWLRTASRPGSANTTPRLQSSTFWLLTPTTAMSRV